MIDKVYYHDGHDLVLKPDPCDLRGWPPGEPEHYGPILLDCFDRGGTFFGAFEGETLAGATVLESRFMGRERLARTRGTVLAHPLTARSDPH